MGNLSKKRQTRKKVRRVVGGFYPSVMEGVRASTILLPFAARQAYSLYNRKTRKTSKKSHRRRGVRKSP